MHRLFWIAFSVLLFLTSIFLSFCTEQKKDEKSIAESSSPFLNLSDQAQYVGTENCISCHSEIHDDYIHTGKGRAFHAVDEANVIEDFNNVHVYDSFSGYHYTALWINDDMIVREYRLKGRDTTYKRDIRAQFVIGSGNQTRSYLFEENGYFYELPITWYVKKGIWDLSPGYENGANTRFSRPISQMCMNCHNSDFEFVDNSVNKFLSLGSGIGCEKCHGPGNLHVEKMQTVGASNSEEIDYTIVNPKHLSLELQFDVCRQCHLEGVTVSKEGKDFMDFKPGMSLSSFWEVFIPVGENANDFGFASHVERLQMSKCFKASGVKMNCTTCHDAHKPLAENAQVFYNEKCQTCHGIDACGADHQTLAMKDNNCIGCHMPKDGTTDIPHVSTSDHYIRVHGDNIERPTEGSGLKEFKNFTTGETIKRDVFLANLEYYEKVEQNPGYLDRISEYLSEVEKDQQIKYYYLKNADPPQELISNEPSDEINPYTAFYIGEILKRKSGNAIPWLERAVALAPENLEFATRLGSAYLDKKDFANAKIVYLGVLNKNGYEIPALVNLGFIYQLEGDFPRSLEITKRALEIDPLYLRARENLINIYLNMGDLDLAIEKLNALILDYPQNAQYAQLKSRLEEG